MKAIKLIAMSLFLTAGVVGTSYACGDEAKKDGKEAKACCSKKDKKACAKGSNKKCCKKGEKAGSTQSL